MSCSPLTILSYFLSNSMHFDDMCGLVEEEEIGKKDATFSTWLSQKSQYPEGTASPISFFHFFLSLYSAEHRENSDRNWKYP